MRSALGFTLLTSAIVLTTLARGREPAFKPEVPEIPPAPLGLDADLVKMLEDTAITPERVALG